MSEQQDSDAAPLLAVRDLVVRFSTDEGHVTAVDGVSFDVPRSSTVALVGESGCGKSVTAHSIMRILPMPPAELASGTILLDGDDLLALSERNMRAVRGERVSIVFQDPMAALNPVYTVGSQVSEAFRIHRAMRRSVARRKAIELLERVGFPDAEARFDHYPLQLSGGMCQRVLIAMALACDPELMIADEPTTALDMLGAAQITELLADLRRERDMSLLLISHDIAAVAASADYVVVLYAGEVVERGDATTVLRSPRHPYTRALLRSVPPLRARQRRRRPTPTRLPAIDGTVPILREDDTSTGCRFVDRCPEAMDRCRQEAPELLEADGDVWARCFLVEDGVVLPLTRAMPERPDDDDDVPESTDEVEEELERAMDKDSIRRPARSANPQPDGDDAEDES